VDYAAEEGCGEGIPLEGAHKRSGSFDSEEARGYGPAIRVLQVGNWRRSVGAAADRRAFEDLGPLFAVSARNSVQVFTSIPGVFPCPFSDSLRLAEHNKDDVERRKFLEDQVKEAVPAGIEVELTNQPNWSSSEFSLVAEFSLKVPGWASSTGHRTIVPSGLLSGRKNILLSTATGCIPLTCPMASRKSTTFNIQSPKGWSVQVLPKPIHEDAKAVEFSHRMGDLAGNLNIRGEVRCDLMLVPRTNMECLEAFTGP
jgi:hypothetical protein